MSCARASTTQPGARRNTLRSELYEKSKDVSEQSRDQKGCGRHHPLNKTRTHFTDESDR
jgi:hypothetical protein